MPLKLGKGGEGQELYSDETGKYLDDGIPNKSEYVNNSTNNLGQELSNEQKEFFKDSKIRDENGNLLVLYHGTTNGGFDSFNTKAIFLTDSLDISQTYSKSINKGYKFSKTNYELYANIKKPFIVDCNGNHWAKIETDNDDFISANIGDVSNFDKNRLSKIIESYLNTQNVDFYKEKNGFGGDFGYIEINDEYISTLKNDYYNLKDFLKDFLGYKFYTTTEEILGKVFFDPKYSDYDGIIFKNIIDAGGTFNGNEKKIPSNVYVAFSPNQLKSIDNFKPKKTNSLHDFDEETQVMKKYFNLGE